MKKGIAIGLIVVVVLACLGFAIYRVNTKNTSKIEVMAIEKTQKDKVFMNGKIEADNSKVFYKDVTKGTVDSVKVKDGSDVKKGATLFTYKNEAVIDQIESLNDQIKEAKKSKNSSSTNNQAQQIPGLTSQIDSQINSQISSLESQIKSLEKKKYESITAPFAGKVTVNNNANDPTTPFITLYTKDNYVSATVSEKDYGKIQVDDEVEINITSINLTLIGMVKSIGDNPVESGISAASASMLGGSSGGSSEGSNISSYKVDIQFKEKPDEKVKNGFHVQATKATMDDTIKVPEAAVLSDGEGSYCLKVVDKKLVKQPVVVGEMKGKTVTITSGIKIGDSIVKNPNTKMKEGDTVE